MRARELPPCAEPPTPGTSNRMMSMPDRGGIDEGLQQLETGFDATAHPQRCSGAVPGSGVDPQRLVADSHQPG